MAIPTLEVKNEPLYDDLPKVECVATIGFQGSIRNGLVTHPDKIHIIYALGNTVVVRDVLKSVDHFLSGHTNFITCLCISKSGKYLASGQQTHMGYKTLVIIWDFYKRQEFGRHKIHTAAVYSVSFSPSDLFLASLGGEDDGNVVCYNMETKEPWCGFKAATGREGLARVLKYSSNWDHIFMTAGQDTIRLWELDSEKRKLHFTMVQMGQIKRIILCIEFDAFDNFAYCGTTSGDIIKVKLNITKNELNQFSYKPVLAFCMGRKTNPKIKNDREAYNLGVLSVSWLKTDELLIGTGDGTLVRVYQREVKVPLSVVRSEKRLVGKKEPCMKRITYLVEVNKDKVIGGITSIALRGEGNQVFLGTKACHIYRFNVTDFRCELLYTCHDSMVNDLAFPRKASDVFVTATKETVRVWNLKSHQELLRITVPNMVCHAIDFSADGQSIISGWDDGKLRAHTPQTGKLLYLIHDAHTKAVTALATTHDNQYIISGGGEGIVRVWKITPLKQVLHEQMKEHRAPVSCIRVSKNDKECVSSSTDGSCIVWDLQQYKRRQVVYAHSLFQATCFGAKECQILTCGTNRNIEFWEVYDGALIRELTGSQLGSVNALDLSKDEEYFITAGEDRLLKVWKYQEGTVMHVGFGHSATITVLRVSPDGQYIVSASEDGAIIIWKFPVN